MGHHKQRDWHEILIHDALLTSHTHIPGVIAWTFAAEEILRPVRPSSRCRP